MSNKYVSVKYRYCKNGRWSTIGSISFSMENPDPSESMIRNKIMSKNSSYDDVEVIDFTVR